MAQLSDDQMDALTNLMEQLAVAENTVVNAVKDTVERRSSRLANQEPINYKSYNATGVKGGKRKIKRKMRGGGVCDNWAYNLAIDSVLVMAGAAGTSTVAYAGWTALSAFMDAFGFKPFVIAIITAVYDVLRVISIHLVFNITPAAWTAFRTSATFSAGFAYDSVSEIVNNRDAIIDAALFRYILTENNAITDINTILATLERQYAALRGNVSSWTRSGQEKMVALQGQIDRLSSAAIGHAATGLVAAQPANDLYIRIKDKICRAIDSGIEDVCLINEIIQLYGFHPIETNEGAGNSCTISGGRRRRKSKRSTRRGKRSTKRTKKNSRRSSRRK